MKMEMIKEIKYRELENGIYEIMGPPVGFFCYLVQGSEKALLIDTGMGIGSLKTKVQEITSLPVTVICTHGHPDHAGGVAEFGKFLLCPADEDVYEKMATKEFREGDVSRMPGGEDFVKVLQPTGPKPDRAEDGMEIDLGGRVLEVVFTPGHTHGSLSVFDRNTGALFTGDNVQGFETAIREWNASDMATYLESLYKMKALEPKMLLGGHRPNINPPEQIDRYIACAGDLVGGAEGEEQEMRFGGKALCYEKEGVRISYTIDKLGK